MKTLRIIYAVLVLIMLASCVDRQSEEEKKVSNMKKSDPSTILKIISTDPTFLPNKKLQEQANEFLAKVFENSKTEAIITDTIEFVDQGQNFDSIICPFCKKDIETEYWQEAMDKADQNHFTDLTFVTPCCNEKTSLNDLNYITAAGFAKFVLTVEDPENVISENDLKALQEILNTRLRAIYAHY